MSGSWPASLNINTVLPRRQSVNTSCLLDHTKQPGERSRQQPTARATEILRYLAAHNL